MNKVSHLYIHIALIGLVSLGVGCGTIQHNFHTVREDDIYRSGQLPSTTLERVIEKKGVRSVVNLRGESPNEAWYTEEKAVCEANNVGHFDFSWTKSALPEPASLAGFVAVLQGQPRPILVHCQGGTHRTGVGAAIALLLEGGTVAEARDELQIFFGDAPIGRVLDLYEGSEIPFDRWVTEVYPELYAAETG